MLNVYKKSMGKLTLASVLLTSPILVALPSAEAYADAETTEGMALEKLIEDLPNIANISIEKDGAAILNMQLMYWELDDEEQLNLKNEEKYEAIIEKVITEFEKVYKNSNFDSGDSSYFFTSFMNTQRLINDISQLKDLDSIQLEDRLVINELYRYFKYAEPYYEKYIQPTTSYTPSDLVNANNKVTMLFNANELEKKIQALPSVEQLSYTDYKKFKETQNAYKTLMDSTYLESPEAIAAVGKYTAIEKRFAEIENHTIAKPIIEGMSKVGIVDNVVAKDNDNLQNLLKSYSEILIQSVKETINYSLLQKLSLKAGQLAAVEVDEAIQKLGDVANIKLENEFALNEINTAYEKLITANAKGNVLHYDVFRAMQKRLEQLKTAMLINKQITNLPKLADLQDADRQSISKIRQQLDTLDDAVKVKIENYSIFIELENAIKAEKQDELIVAINEKIADLSNITKKELMQLIGKFELLTKDNKALIINQQQLAQKVSILATGETDLKASLPFYEATERFMKQLPKETSSFVEYKDWLSYEQKIINYKENIKAVTSLEFDINQLPKLEQIKDIDITRIKKVYEQYEKLSAEAKTLISSKYREKLLTLYDWSETRQEKIASEIVVDLINQLPDEITLQHTQQVEEANKQYNELTNQQKAAVTNYDQLHNALKYLVELNNRDITNLNNDLLNFSAWNIDISGLSKIAEFKLAYYKLSSEQQKLIINFNKIQQAEQRIDNLYEEVSRLEQLINSLNPLQNTEAVKQARTTYNNMTYDQRALVRNIATLEAFEQYIKNGFNSNDPTVNQLLGNLLQTQNSVLATKVVSLIDQLPSDDKLTLDNQLAIMQARESYNQLTPILQTRVNNLSKLTKAEAMMEILQKSIMEKTTVIDDAISKIAGKVTLAHKTVINEIRQEIDRLSVIEQSYLKKYDVFEELEAQLNSLEVAEMKAVQQLNLQIAALPPVNKLTLSYEAIIQEIENDYKRLNAEQQKKIINIAKLIAAKLKMESLQKTTKEQQIKGKKTVFTVTAATNMTTQLSGNATAKAKITVFKGRKKIGQTTVSLDGKYKLKIARQKKNSQLRLVVVLNKKTINTKNIKVGVAKVKAATSLIATTKTITGRATKNTKIKIYVGSKLLKQIKVNTNGEFKTTIPQQRKGIKISVVVFDNANNKSKAKTVVVK